MEVAKQFRALKFSKSDKIHKHALLTKSKEMWKNLEDSWFVSLILSSFSRRLMKAFDCEAVQNLAASAELRRKEAEERKICVVCRQFEAKNRLPD